MNIGFTTLVTVALILTISISKAEEELGEEEQNKFFTRSTKPRPTRIVEGKFDIFSKRSRPHFTFTKPGKTYSRPEIERPTKPEQDETKPSRPNYSRTAFPSRRTRPALTFSRPTRQEHETTKPTKSYSRPSKSSKPAPTYSRPTRPKPSRPVNDFKPTRTPKPRPSSKRTKFE